MTDETISIAEYARATGTSRQAVYKKLSNPKSELYQYAVTVTENGKSAKKISKAALVNLNDNLVNLKTGKSDNPVNESVNLNDNLVNLMKEEIDRKNEEINRLFTEVERLTLLLADCQNQLKTARLPQQLPAPKRNILQKLADIFTAPLDETHR